MAVDLEQEVYRTKIRYFGETEIPVEVYLFTASEEMRDILRQRFKGCHIEDVHDAWEFDEFKIFERKGNEHVKRLFEWIDNDFLINGNVLTGNKHMKIPEIKNKVDLKKHKQWSYIIKNYIEMFDRRRLRQKEIQGVKYLIKY